MQKPFAMPPKATRLPKPRTVANTLWRLPKFRYSWVALLVFPLFFSCRKAVPEDIPLPYAKKKFTPDMLADSTARPDTAASFLRPFLWLESRLFEEERLLWSEKQQQASDRYLNMLFYRGNGELSSDISWKNAHVASNASLFHQIIPVCLPQQKDTLPLHLFYRENSFENGQNPTVLMPYDEALPAYLPPPEAFFETGGILAVLGEPRHVVIRDSSRFFAKADSLARWIWRDTAQAAMHRRNYRNFKNDSLMVAKYTKVTEKDMMPDFKPEHLVLAANLLVASMYTTPFKMALLAIENGNTTAEQTLLERGDLFRAAVLDLRRDSTGSPCRMGLSDPPKDNQTAVLMNDTENRRAVAAFMQDQMLRKTGAYPFLLVQDLRPQDAWRFMLYHIAKEEGVVEVR